MASEVQEKNGSHDRARIVRRYLSALDARKPGRSTARTVETVLHRMHQVDTLLLSADPVQRLHLTQERIDLHAEQLRLQTSNGGDFDALEKAFVRVARAYGDRHGVTYSAWRQVGVDSDVLAKAGIHQQSKPGRAQAPTDAAAVERPAGPAPTDTAPIDAAPTSTAPTSTAPTSTADTTAARAEGAGGDSPVAKKAPAPKKAPVAKKATPKKKTAPAPASTVETPEQQQLTPEANVLS